MPEPFRILFVCTGNICRSPMAEGFARSRLEALDLSASMGVEVGSAGIAGFDGDRATVEAVLAMRDRGIDITGHRARSVTPALLEASDLVMTMEELQRRRVLALGARSPVCQLLKLGEAAGELLLEPDDGSSGRDARQRLSRLALAVAGIESDGAWKRPEHSYAVVDPIGMPFHEYERVADEMVGPIENILRVLLT